MKSIRVSPDIAVASPDSEDENNVTEDQEVSLIAQEEVTGNKNGTSPPAAEDNL